MKIKKTKVALTALLLVASSIAGGNEYGSEPNYDDVPPHMIGMTRENNSGTVLLAAIAAFWAGWFLRGTAR